MKSSLSAFLRGGILWVALGLVALPGKSFGQVLVSLGFTGGEQIWVVPSGINSIRIEAAGGGGGGGYGKAGGGGGGATSVLLGSGSGAVLWMVAGGGGAGGGGGNSVTAPTYGGNGGTAAYAYTSAGGWGTTGPDGGGVPHSDSPGIGGEGGYGGDEGYIAGGRGGTVVLPGDYGLLYIHGGFGFGDGDHGGDSILWDLFNYGGPGGGGGGGAGAGGGGFWGGGYTGGGGGGGAGGSYSVGTGTSFAPIGGLGDGGYVGGGDGGNGALVTAEFSVNAGDQISIFVGGGGESWTPAPNAGNGWVTLSVPEPGSANLLLLGLAAVLARTRRFRR